MITHEVKQHWNNLNKNLFFKRPCNDYVVVAYSDCFPLLEGPLKTCMVLSLNSNIVQYEKMYH